MLIEIITKDYGTITSDELEGIISSNTFSGLQAQTKFVFWKKV